MPYCAYSASLFDLKNRYQIINTGHSFYCTDPDDSLAEVSESHFFYCAKLLIDNNFYVVFVENGDLELKILEMYKYDSVDEEMKLFEVSELLDVSI